MLRKPLLRSYHGQGFGVVVLSIVNQPDGHFFLPWTNIEYPLTVIQPIFLFFRQESMRIWKNPRCCLYRLESTPQPKSRLGACMHYSGYISRAGLGRADEVLLTLRLYGDGFRILRVLEQIFSKSIDWLNLLNRICLSHVLAFLPLSSIVHGPLSILIFGYTGPYEGHVGTFLQWVLVITTDVPFI